METPNKSAIRELVRERRSLLNRIAATEVKLAMLKRRVTLAEVKLVCFGHDMEKLRSAKPSERLFKGRSIIRRIADIQRVSGRKMKPKELTVVLAAQDGLDPTKCFVRVSGRRRVRAAIKRARKRLTAVPCPTSGTLP